MHVTTRTETEARLVAERKLLPAGLRPGRIKEASDQVSAKQNDMIHLLIGVPDDNGNEWDFHVYLTNTPLGAKLLRHACEAIPGGLAKYEAGEIFAAMFPGHDVRVHIDVERKRGFRPRNIITDVMAADTGVVSLRPAG